MSNDDTTGKEVAVYGPRTSTNMSSIELAPAAWQLAHRVAGTDFVPTAMRGKPEAVLACILTGHELGIGEMAALRSIHVIEGRPAMSAELMRALVNQKGHELWVEESSSTRVTVGGKRANGTRETKVTWTMDDAKRAGLDGRQNWRRYPRAMLMARATAELCRAVFPDVLAGISHTVEELSDGDLVDIDYGPPEVADPAAPEAPKGRTMKAAKAATSEKSAAPSAPDKRTPPPASEAPLLPGEEDDIIDAEVVEDEHGLTDADADGDADTTDDAPTPADDAWAVADAAVAEDVADTPVDTGPRYTGPQIVAMKFAAMGIDDRDLRLQMVGAIIEREITSGNDLTADEVKVVLETLNEDADARKVTDDGVRLEGDEVEVPPPPTPQSEAAPVEVSGHVDEGAAPSSRRSSSPNPSGWTGDQWRDLIKRRGIKAAAVLKQARVLAGGPVATLDDIAGTGVAQDLVDWLEDATLER